MNRARTALLGDPWPPAEAMLLTRSRHTIVLWACTGRGIWCQCHDGQAVACFTRQGGLDSTFARQRNIRQPTES